MYQVVSFICNKLNQDFPVHLLGIGDPQDIWTLVKSGIDTFDCVSPTRLARHGIALTRDTFGKINIFNSKFAENLKPINVNCACVTCSNYSLSYLHHLFKSGEILGQQLVTAHNIFFMNNLMKYIREAINKDNLEKAEESWYSN